MRARQAVLVGLWAWTIAAAQLAANEPPAVSAGSSRLVAVGVQATLSGTASDLEQDALTYTWTRTGGSGPAVVLTDANRATATFTPPLGGDYAFLLSVADTGGNVSTATVTVYASGSDAGSRLWLSLARTGPSTLTHHAMVYDARRQRTVLFGGLNSLGNPVADTWEWDGNAWTQRQPAVSPQARFYHSMVFDSGRGRVVLFGGQIGGSYLSDIWEYDGDNWSEVVSSPSPPARVLASLAYDPARGRTVLFGGFSAGSVDLADTWEWSGTGWTDKTPAAGSPPARDQHRMAYDPLRGKVVLFGGATAGGSPLFADTWEWDGDAWAQVPTPSGPAARFSHGMAFDTVRQRVVVFGGQGVGRWFADTFELAGTVWISAAAGGDVPSSRGQFGYAFDTARGRAVLFGGAGDSASGDTYEQVSGPTSGTPLALSVSPTVLTTAGVTAALEASVADTFGPAVRFQWTRTAEGAGSGTLVSPDRATPTFTPASGGDVSFAVTASYQDGPAAVAGLTLFSSASTRFPRQWIDRGSSGPGVRSYAAMAYDALRQRVVLFGGLDVNSNPVAETWEWDGTVWRKRLPAASPGPRFYHSMSYDAGRGRVVLFGGQLGGSYLDETWEWDGTNWSAFSTTQAPPPRIIAGMAYDESRKRTVLFGGFGAAALDLEDTWEWSGTAWENRSPAAGSPAPRDQHAMAYDPVRRRVVLFGGATAGGPPHFADTWAWDGAAWNRLATGGAPLARFSHAMAYDTVRQRVMAFGGVGAAHYSDAFELDGDRWSAVAATAPIPSPRKAFAMAYDTARGRLVVLGGTAGQANGETWELLSGPAQGAPFALTVRDSLQTAPGSAVLLTAAVDDPLGASVTYSWSRAGGTGPAVALANPGSSTASFTPPVTSDYSFRVEVSAGAGRTATGSVDVYATTTPSPKRPWLSRDATGPSSRSYSAMAYDAVRRRVVLFGGLDAAGNSKADTWEFDGSSWQERAASQSPTPRFYHSMAYDSARRRVVLFGGQSGGSYVDDTWEWDGTNWSGFSAEPAPSPRILSAMAFDARRSRIVLFGGFHLSQADLADTWEWSGAGWTDVTPAAGSPGARDQHRIAYDPTSQRVVLFGGATNGQPPIRGDTWAWDGTAWAERFPASPPPERFAHGLDFDTVRQRLVLFGGRGNSGDLDDTHELDASGWRPVVTGAFRPPTRAAFGFAYAAAFGRSVVFGGLAPSASGDTWELASGQRFSAFAGADRLVPPGLPVTLQGGGIDGDGDPVFYSWTRNGGTGPAVTLDDPTFPTPTFTPPVAGSYRFLLTVSDGQSDSATSAVEIAVNSLPTVSAGNELTVNLGTPVTLAGSASDGDGDALTYSWSRTGGSGPAVTLANAASARASFTPTQAGSYLFSLTVLDSRGGSAAAEVTILANTLPVASAGPPRTVPFGSPVTLAGTASDADGDPLAFSWARKSSAPGSGPAVALVGASTANPTFTPPVAGSYTFTLTVTDGRGGVSVSEVTVTANGAPVAAAGSDFTVNAGSRVTLSGSAVDPNGDPIGYSWTRSGGTGPVVLLTDSTSSTPSFRPVVAGTYVFTVTASDGRGGVGTASVTVTVNTLPIASAGSDQTVPVDRLVTLSGSGADADGDSLGFSWVRSSAAPGNGPAVTLAGPDGPQPTFTPAATGTYTFVLTVSDGRGGSSSASVTVTVVPATQSNLPPSANAGAGQTVTTGTPVVLAGSASDPDGDPITYAWNRTGGTGPAVALSDPAVPTPSFIPPQAGTYSFELGVSDGRGGSATASVTVQAVDAPPPNRPPTAGAGADQTVARGAPVTLSGSATDPDGDAVAYSWARTGGTGATVVLSDAGTAAPSFTPSSAGTYVFTVTVSDGRGGVAAASATVTVEANRAPVGAASAPGTVNLGSQAVLAGSATDPDGDALTYSWARSGGTGPTVAVSDAASATARFTPVAAGTYEFTLTVSDPAGARSARTVTVAANTQPVASAGTSRTVAVGALASLSGDGFDADGDPVAFAWTRSGGTGPAIQLNDAASVAPSFTPTAPGSYVFALTVTDGRGGRGTSAVTLTAVQSPVGNLAPSANAGADRTVVLGPSVRLNGSGVDPESGPITYAWRRDGGTGPAVPLADPAAPTPSFTPVVAGSYTFELTVTDGQGSSAVSRVTVTVAAPAAANAAPVVVAGPTRAVSLRAVVTLAAQVSDPDGDMVAYAWVRSGGTGPTVVLAGADSASPSFTPEAPGSYVFQLTASDGRGGVTTGAVAVNADSPPTAAIRTQSVRGGPQVIELDGSGSRGPTGQPLDVVTYTWSLTSAPTGAAGFGSSAAVARYDARRAGTYAFALTVESAGGGTATTGVSVTIENGVPSADAGADRSLILPRDGLPAGLQASATIELDGRDSSDPNGDPLTYRWTVAASPDRTVASPDLTTLVTFSDRSAPNPTVTFRTDLAAGSTSLAAAGVYRFRMAVSDGVVESADEVTVVANDPSTLVPRADPGIDASYRLRFDSPGVVSRCFPDPTVVPATDDAGKPLNLRSFVRLDGHESVDPKGLPLTYQWTVARDALGGLLVPASSNVTVLSGAASSVPTFVPDVEGAYVFELVVSNGRFESVPARVQVLVSLENDPPTAEALAEDQERMRSATAQDPVLAFAAGQRVVLRGDGSFDDDPGDLQRLTYLWRQTRGESVALLPSATAAVVSYIPPRQGIYSFELTVTDPKGVAGPAAPISVLALPEDEAAPSLTVVSSIESQGATATATGEDDGDGVRVGTPRSLRVTLPVRVALTATFRSSPGAARHRLLWNQVDGPTVLLSPAADTDTTSAVSRTSFQPTTSRVHVFEAVADRLGLDGRPTGVSVRRRISVIVDSSEVSVPVAVGTVCPPTVPGDAPENDRTVTLDGSDSANFGEVSAAKPRIGKPLAFVWRQLAGPAIVLSNPSARITTFVMPRIGRNRRTRYVFSLFVDNGRDRSAPFNVAALQAGTETTSSDCSNLSSAQVYLQLFLGERALSPAPARASAEGGATIDGVVLPGSTRSGDVMTLEQVQADGTPIVAKSILRSYALQFINGGATQLTLGDSGTLFLDSSILDKVLAALVLPPGSQSAAGAVATGSGGGCHLSAASPSAAAWLPLVLLLLVARRKRRG